MHRSRCLLVFLAFPLVGNAQDDSSMEELLSRHRASLQVIATLSCEGSYETKPAPPNLATIGFKYWQEQRKARLSEVDLAGFRQERLRTDREVIGYGFHVDPETGEKQSAMVMMPLSANFSAVDVPERLLLAFRTGDSGLVDLTELVTRFSNSAKAAPIKVGGKRLYQLTLELKAQGGSATTKSSSMVLDLDPTVGFLVRKLRLTAVTVNPQSGKEATVGREEEIQVFSEVQPGVFFPTECLRTSFPRASTGKFKIWDVQVNQPIPASVWTLAVPEGTRVTDRVRNLTYLTDANGKPRGEPGKIDPNLKPPVDASTWDFRR